MNSQLLYKIALGMIPGIGPINAKRLIAYIGSLEGVFSEKTEKLKKIPGINKDIKEIINVKEILKNAENEIKFIEKNNIKPIFFLDDNYPYRLKECEDSPVVLYMKGDVDLNSDKIISIVGTRSATNYGKSICRKLIAGLKDMGHNPVIVSGLAYGIDYNAHKAALECGFKTIAVLGHGLDMIYPAVHADIAKEIKKQGCLLTEFHTKSKKDKSNFVRRNRIVAGIADATIVVESAKKGGALITADIANSYNRDVFAFPGNINNKYSEGCNKLIKTNKAALIETAGDIEYILGWKSNKKPKIIQTKIFDELNKEEKQIVEILKKEGKLNIDILRFKSRIPLNTISSILLGLEFKGIIESFPGKVYGISE